MWLESCFPWSVSFLKNPDVGKVVSVLDHEEVCVHPLRIQDVLLRSWGQIKVWAWKQLHVALEILEDKYSFCLPRVEFGCQIGAYELSCAAKNGSDKHSALGVDGWTHAELALLPRQVWEEPVDIFASDPVSVFNSLTGVFKRVPLPKVEVCEALQVRPLDVYSAILRTHSSSLVLNLKVWACKVLSLDQYASKGGTLLKNCLEF